jgi:hypothetical protein
MMVLRDNNQLMYLFNRLDQIQFATKVQELKTAMHEFTHELLQQKVQPQNSTGNQSWNPRVSTQNGRHTDDIRSLPKAMKLFW